MSESNNRGRATPRNVTMYSRQWKVVDSVNEYYGLNTSGALRLIVEQWSKAFGVKSSVTQLTEKEQ